MGEVNDLPSLILPRDRGTDCTVPTCSAAVLTWLVYQPGCSACALLMGLSRNAISMCVCTVCCAVLSCVITMGEKKGDFHFHPHPRHNMPASALREGTGPLRIKPTDSEFVIIFSCLLPKCMLPIPRCYLLFMNIYHLNQYLSICHRLTEFVFSRLLPK